MTFNITHQEVGLHNLQNKIEELMKKVNNYVTEGNYNSAEFIEFGKVFYEMRELITDNYTGMDITEEDLDDLYNNYLFKHKIIQ